MVSKSRSSTLYSKLSDLGGAAQAQGTTRLEDFQTLKSVGQGSYGKVYLVRNRKETDADKFYAMKIIRKDLLIDQKKIQQAYVEKEILNTCEHPFIMNLDFVFQNDSRIFFLMKYIEGGDLFHHLQKKRRFKEGVAKFYAAQVLLALGYLHKKRIIYRDILISDFGLSKILSQPEEQTNSLVGTAAYVAPEILRGQGYDKSVDWWALGILIYEMLHGHPPFYDKNIYLMFQKIKDERVQPQYSATDISDEARDLIKQLLQKDSRLRLGSQNDQSDIMKHPWFSDVKFSKLEQKKVKAKYKPEISPLRTSNLTTISSAYRESHISQSDVLKAHQEQFQDLTKKK
ncbi:hypothetical protein FGO68_gene15253 [Halteria grandinella]|uniref:Protein kinase domain-containing protein n=1 Tax=Halteria grandinella TaxID=5974 RepID=A0A8J8SVW7_HALGN|nr:hypothetical protein FGO68_gene15253 [Halteria grandinella]